MIDRLTPDRIVRKALVLFRNARAAENLPYDELCELVEIVSEEKIRRDGLDQDRMFERMLGAEWIGAFGSYEGLGATFQKEGGKRHLVGGMVFRTAENGNVHIRVSSQCRRTGQRVSAKELNEGLGRPVNCGHCIGRSPLWRVGESTDPGCRGQYCDWCGAFALPSELATDPYSGDEICEECEESREEADQEPVA